MNGYEKRTAVKKAAIIDAARELFTLRGMRRVSVGEIAKKAGVSQVSIYNYFNDKNTLAKEAFIAFVDAVIAEYDQIMESDIPFDEKIIRIMQNKSEVVGRISASYFNEQALDDKVLNQVFQDAIKEKADVFYRKFITLGKRDGYIDKNIQTEAAISYLMMLASYIQQPAYAAESDAFKKGMVNLFIYGLIGKR